MSTGWRSPRRPTLRRPASGRQVTWWPATGRRPWPRSPPGWPGSPRRRSLPRPWPGGPGAPAGAARRAGIRRVRCLAGRGATGFCAGLLAPRVYITAAAVPRLGPGALDAVLVHEAALARRRDPLRRLAARAASDALFYLPLARWWSRRQAETAELRADRAAVGYAGRPAVAGA